MIWRVIRQNQRRSAALLAVSALFLAGTGAAIGFTWSTADGPFWGASAALAIWAALYGFASARGQSFLAASMGGERITGEIHPALWNVVDEVRIAAGLKAMPQVWVIPDEGLNAFASGPSPDRSSIAVTSGLLDRLNRDELQGVVAHEMAHITNRDTRFMTLAAVMVMTVQLLADFALRSSRISSSFRRYGSRGRSGSIRGVGIIIGLLAAILTPILARLLYLALSRRREYLADACGVRLTRHPLALASALEKIAERPLTRKPDDVHSAFLIQNHSVRPLEWLATHPPIAKRIEVLRRMAGEPDGDSYEKSYRQVNGSPLLDSWESASLPRPIPAGRAAVIESRLEGGRDFWRAARGWSFSDCDCGVNLRIPKELARSGVSCPSCGRRHFVRPPQEADSSPAQKERSLERLAPGMPHVRASGRWESFLCPSGHVVTLSSAFDAPYALCRDCGVRIPIRYSSE